MGGIKERETRDREERERESERDDTHNEAQVLDDCELVRHWRRQAEMEGVAEGAAEVALDWAFTTAPRPKRASEVKRVSVERENMLSCRRSWSCGAERGTKTERPVERAFIFERARKRRRRWADRTLDRVRGVYARIG